MARISLFIPRYCSILTWRKKQTNRFSAKLSKTRQEKDKIQLSIKVAPGILQSLDIQDVTSQFESVFKNGDKKSKKKVSVDILAIC